MKKKASQLVRELTQWQVVTEICAVFRKKVPVLKISTYVIMRSF
jgi:hypothetical protein